MTMLGIGFVLLGVTGATASEFERVLGGPALDRGVFVRPTKEGGYVVVGVTKSQGEGDSDVWFVRTDASGDEVRSGTFGGPRGDRLFSVAPADDGGYVLAGQTFSEGAGDRDVWIVKTDADGRMEWSRTFGGAASDVGDGVTRTTDDRFVVTGYTTSLAADGDDPYLVAIDATGDTAWTRVIPLVGHNHTITGDQAADGGFYLVGFSEDRERGTVAALLVKTDPHGRRE